MMISFTIIILLAIGLIMAINPGMLIKRGNDITRKRDLDSAKKALEEYVNDNGCYPQPTQICTNGNNGNNCILCGKDLDPKFTYFDGKNICDPKHGTSDYMYQTEAAGLIVASCPKFFRIYSVLESPYHAQEDVWGCKVGGCGVLPYYGYSYLVTSPGAPIENIVSQNWYCYTNDCIQCTPYERCVSQVSDCYGKTLYPYMNACCVANDPNSRNCKP